MRPSIHFIGESGFALGFDLYFGVLATYLTLDLGLWRLTFAWSRKP